MGGAAICRRWAEVEKGAPRRGTLGKGASPKLRRRRLGLAS
jgi:hypothetical protein